MTDKWIILALGIIFLFLFSSVVPISIGHNVEVKITTKEKSRKIAYACEYPGYKMVSFDLTAPDTFTILGPYTGVGFAAGGAWAKSKWYVVDSYSAALMYYDLGTKTLFNIGGTGTPYNDISYDINTGIMYGASSYNLYTIDMHTGAQTLVGSWGSNHLMIDIVIDNSGICYGHDIISDSIYIINKETAEVTLLCPKNCTGKIDYDHDNNIFYLSDIGALYIYNLTNGERKLVGYFPGGAEIGGLTIPYKNSPPDSPTITGPTIGKIRTSYNYSFNTVDPENNNIKYIIDWGDNNTDKTDFNKSGINVKVSHTWSFKGNYIIKVKAEDTDGLVGPEVTLSVSIPKFLTLYTFNFLDFFDHLPIFKGVILCLKKG